MDPKDCLAIHDGQTTVQGLDAPVTITRDRWGIPHIKAAGLRDAFFAQGFCLAQDRAWQIEMLRHMAHGRAAALMNKGLLGLDIQNRTLGFSRYAKAEWASQSADARIVLEAYAAGINAAIATQPRPFEFISPGHTMQPWAPVDSLAIVKLINSGQQWATKLKFGQVSALLGADAVDALIAEVPRDAAVIVPSGVRWAGETHPFAEDIVRAMGEPDGLVAAGGGSNCCVIAGSRSASGAPLVAGDPHLQMSLPGQWYVVHMDCPDFNVAGPCNPGYPGPVFYGHNTRIAWAMTHAQGDRWDLYRERIRPGASGPEALYRGTWEPIDARAERFEVRGGDSVTETIWTTRHGPVTFGKPERDVEVIAARWGLHDAAHDTDAMLAMLRASSTAEARDALRRYDSVSGNFCVADTAGDIAYQYTGRIPKRPAWMVPVPGWTGEHEWDGDVPREDLPGQDNPDTGYLLTANNRTTTPDYPHYLTFVATSFRADRMRELIEGHDGTFAFDDLRAIQSDQVSIVARALGARFAASIGGGDGAARLRALFEGWDGQLAPHSAAALAYDAVSEALAASTVRAFYARMPKPPVTTALEERRLVYQQVMSGSPTMLGDSASWDDAITSAMDSAHARLVARFGEDSTAWRWDAAHQLKWRHNLGRDGELADVLNLAPIPVGGDGHTLFCTTAERDGSVTAGVSYRQIMDLADLNSAQICIPPGNSGQPGSAHYADNADRWLNVEYHPLFVEWADIAANAEAELMLTPAGWAAS